MKPRVIFTGLDPNMTPQDVKTAGRFLFLPWLWPSWRHGEAPLWVEKKLQTYIGVPHAVTFDSGRSSLLFGLKALGVGEGDEVLVQAYTCLVVINAIRWLGARPVYVDIDVDFNLDPADLAKKITSRAKALIIQHTFGIPAKMNELLSTARTHRLPVIEDCAHTLGNMYGGKKLGTFGELAIFSFGSDKALSCARGGAVVTGSQALAEKLRAYQHALPDLPRWRVFQHLAHYPVMALGKRWYHLGIGKWLLWAARRAGIINRIIYRPEKRGERLAWFPAKLPQALATILLSQLNNLDAHNLHRKKIASIYRTALKKFSPEPNASAGEYAPLRYLLLVDNPAVLERQLQRHGVYLGDWYRTAVAPTDISAQAAAYEPGRCPRAEEAARRSINLPTDRHITEHTAKNIAELVMRYV